MAFGISSFCGDMRCAEGDVRFTHKQARHLGFMFVSSGFGTVQREWAALNELIEATNQIREIVLWDAR